MKNLFLLITFMSAFGFGSNGRLTSNSKVDDCSSLYCNEFSVGLSIGIASISTTVYICCGDMFAGPLGTVPCRSVTKRFYDLYLANQSLMRNVTGIELKELFPNTKNLETVKEVIITQSSTQKDENGRTIAVKKGKYNVINGFVNFEYEILKE